MTKYKIKASVPTIVETDISYMVKNYGFINYLKSVAFNIAIYTIQE